MQTVALRGSTLTLQPAPFSILYSHKLHVDRAFRTIPAHLNDLFFSSDHDVCNAHATIIILTDLNVLIPLTSKLAISPSLPLPTSTIRHFWHYHFFHFHIHFHYSTHSRLFTSLIVPAIPTILTILNSLTTLTSINILSNRTVLTIRIILTILKSFITPTSLTLLDIHAVRAVCIISFVCAVQAVCSVYFLQTVSLPFVLKTLFSQNPLFALSVSSSRRVLAAKLWLSVPFGPTYLIL